MLRQSPIPETKRTNTGLSVAQRLRKVSYRGRRVQWVGYLFVFPLVVLLLVTTVLPILSSVAISFTKWGIVGAPEWVGLANFSRMLQDRDIPLVYGNTFQYAAIVVPATVLTALMMALFVNQRLPGSSFARTAFFAPTVLSITVTSIIWIWILDTRFGILNIYLGKLGIPQIPWLTNPRWVLPAIAITSVWANAGFYMVILLAALQDIPREVLEAAKVDGANAWQSNWFVTLPLLRPALSLTLTLEIIGALRVFGQMYLMTQGGPGGSSLSIIYLIYTKAFTSHQLGYGAALSLLHFGVILIVTLLQFRIFRKTGR